MEKKKKKEKEKVEKESYQSLSCFQVCCHNGLIPGDCNHPDRQTVSQRGRQAGRQADKQTY